MKLPPLDDEGNWVEFRRTAMSGTRALFLDRDGVIIEDRGYVGDPRDVVLMPGVIDIMRRAQSCSIPSVIVTNQSGVGRGYFDWDDFARVQERMLELLGAAGVEPSAVLACPFHAQALGRYRVDDHPMRKPRPGMLVRAAQAMRLSLADSIMIGDKQDDMAAAVAAGLRGGVWITRSPRLPDANGTGSMTIRAFPAVLDCAPFVESWLESSAFDPRDTKRG